MTSQYSTFEDEPQPDPTNTMESKVKIGETMFSDSPITTSSSSTTQTPLVPLSDVSLARMYCLGGTVVPPCLWIVNVFFFWNDCFGRGKNDSYDSNQVTTSIPPNDAEMAEGGIGVTSEQQHDGEDRDNGRKSEMRPKEELIYWVKRSALLALTTSIILISWAVTFVCNREKFGPRWFMMNQDEGDLTGW